MKLYQVLNNNVVTSLVDGKEIIIIGTGIGFKKQKGDVIDEGKIQSKFYPANNTLAQQTIQLLEEIPEKVVDIVVKIVKKAEKDIGTELNNGIYFTLVDHISFALERYKEQKEIKNVLLWDIKRLYKKEFEIGKYGVELLNETCGVQLTEEEAAFIAVHVMNAEFNVGIDMMESMTRIINEVIRIIEYYFKIEFDKDSLLYLRLVNHLKFFAQRVLNGTPYDDRKNILFDVIRNNYVEAFACSCQIKEFMMKKYNCKLTEEELVYLTIHIQRLTDTNN
ncbi:BglG family transcription antiterminator LicT [Oceanobacillus sojae]|uniref:BglG family transcription antiterminator LicT n=1 Tax=Oceanobacillus sojae TaxID=582851 RepID=UPI0021A74E0A|nr:PRD domain-containing protein [Oceanobacillus sojae]MCT1901673.1 PRD domain-containing protein [Oceanobacillus sojae]